MELEQFAYVASHDLQEPLRMVANFTELLREEYSGKLDEEADTYIEFAVDGARRMKRLIHDLLEHARVGRRSDMHVVDLQSLVSELETDLSVQAEECNARFI